MHADDGENAWYSEVCFWSGLLQTLQAPTKCFQGGAGLHNDHWHYDGVANHNNDGDDNDGDENHIGVDDDDDDDLTSLIVWVGSTSTSLGAVSMLSEISVLIAIKIWPLE